MRISVLTHFCLISILFVLFHSVCAVSVTVTVSPNAAVRHLKVKQQQQRQQVLQPTAAAAHTANAAAAAHSHSHSHTDSDSELKWQLPKTSNPSKRTELSEESARHLQRALLDMQHHSCSDANHPLARLCAHREEEHSHAHSFLQSGGQAGSEAHLQAQAKDVHDNIADAIKFVQAQVAIQKSATRKFLDWFAQTRNLISDIDINKADFNYLVVGGGPGGLISALYAFAYGAKSIEVWEKRSTYVLDQLVAAGFLPFDALQKLNADFDISLKQVAFYLHACVQVLAGSSANFKDSPYATNENKIIIRMSTRLLALCRIGDSDPKYSAIGVTGLADNDPEFADPFATEAEQLAYCNYIRDPNNKFITGDSGVQWAVPANHDKADTIPLKRLSVQPNGRGGFIVKGLNLVSIADGARSPLRQAFFGADVNRLWLRDNIPSSATTVDAATFTDPGVFGSVPDGSRYEYDMSLSVKSYFQKDTIVQSKDVDQKKITCGTGESLQHVPTVINAEREDYVLPSLYAEYGYSASPTPLRQSSVLTDTLIDLREYSLGGSKANFRTALKTFDSLSKKGVNTDTDWEKVSLADFGVIAVMSRRGQGLCYWNVRFKYPHAAQWKDFLSRYKSDDSVKLFIAKFVEKAGTALFSNTFDWNALKVDDDVRIFKSPIFYMPVSSKLWTNSLDQSQIFVAISVEGDSSLPAYFVTGRGIKSAANRAEITTSRLVGEAVQEILKSNGGGITKSHIDKRNGEATEYSLRQACKYLSEMVYYKSGTVISFNAAKSLYDTPKDCSDQAQQWKCRCQSAKDILKTYLVQETIAFDKA